MIDTLTVHVTDTGWKVVGIEPVTSQTFVAELPDCGCPRPSKPTSQSIACATGGAGGYHQAHVEAFVKRVASTYRPKADVPMVPARNR